MIRAALLVGGVFAVGACKDKTANPASGSGSVAGSAIGSAVGSGSGSAMVASDAGVADAPGVDAAIDAAVAAVPKDKLISDAGVGPFDAKTPDDEAEIKKRAVGFEVERNTKEGEDHELHEYTLTAGGKAALFIVMNAYRGDDKLFRIDVYDPQFKTELGIGVGAIVAEVLEKYPDLECVSERYDPEADIYRVDRRAFCTTKTLKQIAFELDPKQPKGKLKIDKIAKQKLVSIGWVVDDE